jgi:hypothetical protein
MALYFTESDGATTADGMRRFTIEAATHPTVLWVVIAEMWACSLWLMYLLNRETKAYVRLIWKLGPNRLGIKSHAVVVNDIPMLTTDGLPSDLWNKKDDVGILRAINSALMHESTKSLRDSFSGKSPGNSPKFASPSSRRNPARVSAGARGGEDASPDGNQRRAGPRSDLSGSLGKSTSVRDSSETAIGKDETSAEASRRAKKWMTRNASAVRSFMDSTTPDDFENLRACTKTEMARSTKMKLEAVFGEGCVVSCMPARDARALDKASRNWHAANERHLQALIRESKAQDALNSAEADVVRERGGLGRLPKFKFERFGDSVEVSEQRDDGARGGDDEGLPRVSFGGFGGSSGSFPETLSSDDRDAELGEFASVNRDAERRLSIAGLEADFKKKPLPDPEIARLRAKRDWASKERESARDSLAAALKRFDDARFEYLNDESPSPSMLVVFSRQMDAVLAGQVQVDRYFGSWRTKAAPGPNDLVWHNVALTFDQRNRKNIKARLMAGTMVVFFLVPVNFLGEAFIDVAGDSSSIVSQISIALILIIFLVLGHIMSLVLSRQYGHVAISKMDVTGASIYFWLLVLNLFVSNLSSTPLWTDLIGWVRNPKLVVDELITHITRTSSFFLQFCMLRCAQSAPLELIHPPFHLGLAVKTLVHLLRAGEMPTRKIIQNWTEPENTPLHRVPAQTMMVAFLGLMYCVIAPVFLPVCGIFFSLFYLFWKHTLCYHYMQPYASGQTLWPWLVKHTYVCLVVSQVILMLGLPTLVGDAYEKYESVQWMRLALCPLPILCYLELGRTKYTLQESHKIPVHKHILSDAERELNFAAADEGGGAAAGTVFDERGVVGDVGTFIKRGLKSSSQFGYPGVGQASGERDARIPNSFFGKNARGSFSEVSPSPDKKPPEKASSTSWTTGNGKTLTPEKKVSYNSQSDFDKSTRRLNLSAEEGRSEVQRLIDLGVWRNYQPISIWPQVHEKAAASLIVKRWREKKSVKLSIARRRAEESLRTVGPIQGVTRA